MKKGLFRRILVSYIIIVAVLFIALELYLSSVIKHNYVSKLRENLIVQSRLITEQIPASFTNNLDDFCRKYKEKTGARITIIDDSGRVLGDSDEFSGKMENHEGRPEIQEASINNIGSSIRFSKTLHSDFFYLAIKLDGGIDKGFLRLSVPLHDLEKAISQTRIQIVLASLTALFIAFLFGLFHTRKITKSIMEIASFSKEVVKGNLDKRLFLEEDNELGELGENISEMAHELKTRLIQSEAEKHKIEAVLRNMSDGVMLVDTTRRVILYNLAMKDFLGIKADIEGQTLTETLRDAELMETITKVIKEGKAISQEVEVTYPREIHFMSTAVPFYSHSAKGEISGAVLTLHDITKLKQLEEMRKDFVANVSHEIKTPITAIKGFAETLLEGALDDKENAYKFLETIRNHSERLNSLVSDLLTLSRIELGDIKIEKTCVNLDEIIDSVFATLKNKAQSKGLYLKKEVITDFQKITADRNRLIQILLNLVDNGIKFTEKGGVTVKVKSEKEVVASSLVTRRLSPADFVEISVEDTGIGILQKHIPRLGERFYRVDKARSRDLGGTGLGLAIVKHLVKAHKWDMKIESTQGKGTRVNIICPIS